MSAYIGFTTDKGLIIDLDGTTLNKTGRIAEKLLEEYNLEGYLIIESSSGYRGYNYHIVFNAYLDWKTITKILFGFNKNICDISNIRIKKSKSFYVFL